jgi:hypothetical protein
MLEFAAREYMEVTHRFGIVLALVRREQYDENALGDSLTVLHNVSRRLDLPVTTELFACLIREMVQTKPECVSQSGNDFAIKGAILSSERLAYHLESIYCALKAEIGNIQLRAIPREKAKYSIPDWLEGTKVAAKYPETVDEFYHAGRCFSYGENTACVFHLMRVTEFCLTEVGNSLGVPFDPINGLK